MKKNSMVSLLLIFIGIHIQIANAASLMYVPTGESNELVIIDVENDTIVGRIGELENAHGLSTSPMSDYLVAGSMKVPGTGAGSSKPTAVSDEEHKSHHGDSAAGKTTVPKGPSFLSIVHAKHGHVMRRIAVRGLTHHTAVSPDGKTAVAVHSGAGGISVIDLDSFEVTHTLQTGAWPNYAAFTADGKHVYVSNARPGTISEIDTHQWTIVREFKVGKEPEHLVLGEKKYMLYVANKGDGSISAVNLVNGEVQRTYTTGKNPHGIDLSDDGRWLFVSNKGSEIITRIDISRGTTTEMVLRPAPYHLATIPGKDKLYVSSRKLPKIWVIDASTMTIKKHLDLGKGVAHQMVFRDK